MESYGLGPLFPDKDAWIALFSNVENAKELRGLTVDGNLKACLINPSLIVDTFQVLVAVNKALSYQRNGKLKTKSLYSEILFNLSPTNQINESIKTFGITDTSTDVLLVVVGSKTDAEDAFAAFKGEAVELGTVKDRIDMERLKKLYKVTDLEYTNLLHSVITTMATKDVK